MAWAPVATSVLMSPCSATGTPSCRPVRPSGSMTRVRTKSRKSDPVMRSINSASTQCADVAWYSKRVPGSQLQRQLAKRASRRSLSSQSSGSNGAPGKPDVCSITCSMVITSFPFDAELGDDLGDATRHVDRAFPHQDPHRRRDDGFRRREDDVARLGRARRRASPTSRAFRCAANASWHEGTCPSSISRCARAMRSATRSGSSPKAAGSSVT